jgi:hypothetical protein
LLFLRWIQAELIGLVHRDPFLVRRAKPETAPPLPQKGTRPSSPWRNHRGFRARYLVRPRADAYH